jgi:hypothetical protein
MPRLGTIGRLALLLALLGLTASCGAGGATRPSAVTQPPPTPPDPTSVPTATVLPSASSEGTTAEERTLAEIEIGGGPDMPTEAFGSLWVLSVDGPLVDDGTVPSVHRIDPETNAIIASVELPGRLCQGIGASPDAIWACGPDGLVRIDPATNAIVAEVPLDAALVVSRLAYGADSLWAFATATVGPDLVVRIDPATNAVAATIPLGRVAGTMAFGFDALWVTSPADDVVLRIDPATNGIEVRSTGIEGAGWIAVGAEAIWVSLYGTHGAETPEGAATIVRIDPASGSVTAEIDAGTPLEDSNGLVAADDGIWVRGTDPFLVRLDPSTGEIVDELDLGDGSGDVTVAFGSVWATSETGELVRIDPEP